MSSKAPPPTPKPYMRVLLMALSLIHVLMATGEAYGWTALRPVLYSCGYFDAFSEAERAIKMNVVSTLGISANAMSKLPLGFLLDRCGPRVTAVAGSVLFPDWVRADGLWGQAEPHADCVGGTSFWAPRGPSSRCRHSSSPTCSPRARPP